MPAASANSEVPIHAPATPVGRPSEREANGSANTMTMAQTTPSVIPTDACSRFAAAEHGGEALVQREGAADKEDHEERDQRDDGRLADRNGSGPDEQGEGQG